MLDDKYKLCHITSHDGNSFNVPTSFIPLWIALVSMAPDEQPTLDGVPLGAKDLSNLMKNDNIQFKLSMANLMHFDLNDYVLHPGRYKF